MGTIYRNGFYYGGEKKEVIECNELPETGMSEVLYIKDDCLFYWNGTEFVEISNSDPGMSFDVEKNEIAIGGEEKSLVGSGVKIIKNEEDTTIDNSSEKGIKILNESSELFIGGNNLTSLDGDTRFTMHDDSKLDITKGATSFMHGKMALIMDDGTGTSNSTKWTENKNSTYAIWFNDEGTHTYYGI